MVLGMLIVAVSVLMGVWGADWITGPILKLSRAARRLGAGDFSRRTTLDRADEIGDLFTGFNFMADRLQQTFARLDQAREKLEERVSERTIALDAQNKRLEAEIAERRQSEKELRESEERHRTLLQTAMDGFWMVDMQGRLIEVNETYCRMSGYSARELLVMRISDLEAAETDEETAAHLQIVMAQGEDRFESRHRRKDGSLYPVEISVQYRPVEDGRFVVFLRDVTERKRTEEELQQARDELEHRVRERTAELLSANASLHREIEERKRAEERVFNSKASLSMVLDGISDPITLLDTQFRVKRMNRAARDYYGLTSYQEATGKLCYEVRGKPGPCEGCERPFSELHGFSGSFERKGAMDPDKLEQVVVDAVIKESGAIEAYIVRIYDITQAKKMEKQLIQSEKLASLGLLISGIAHEINNPNMFVSFNIPILRDYLRELIRMVDPIAGNDPVFELCGMPYPEFRTDIFKLVDNMEHGSSRINATVSGLKEFSRTREGTEKRLISLKEVIEKALAICGAELRKRVKSLNVTIPDDLPPLFIDPEAVEQILINLLINAAHALNKTDSWIHVSALPGYRHGHLERCIIEVADNGSGMDEKVRSRIFDPFFTTKASMLGTGLGLYVCKNLIEKLGGSIEVNSQPGVGSIFRVILPCNV